MPGVELPFFRAQKSGGLGRILGSDSDRSHAHLLGTERLPIERGVFHHVADRSAPVGYDAGGKDVEIEAELDGALLQTFPQRVTQEVLDLFSREPIEAAPIVELDRVLDDVV